MNNDFEKLDNYSSFKLTNGMILLDLMQEKNIGFNEILSILGTKSVVNEIINGKRVLKATQITQLAELFKINADIFNMEDDMQEVSNHSMQGQSSFNEPSAFNMGNSLGEHPEEQSHDTENNFGNEMYSPDNNEMKPFWED